MVRPYINVPWNDLPFLVYQENNPASHVVNRNHYHQTLKTISLSKGTQLYIDKKHENNPTNAYWLYASKFY